MRKGENMIFDFITDVVELAAAGIAATALTAVAAPLLIAAAVIDVAGKIIDKFSIQQEMKSKNIDNAIIQSINKSINAIKFEDLDNNITYEMKGDGISDDLYEKMKITI